MLRMPWWDLRARPRVALQHSGQRVANVVFAYARYGLHPFRAEPHLTCQIVEYPVQSIYAYIWHSAAGNMISMQCNQHVSMPLPSLRSAAQLTTSACPSPHSAMHHIVTQRGIVQPCGHATQQCSVNQKVPMFLPILSSAARPRTSACSCSPSAIHHTHPRHDIAQSCRHAQQHAWLQPGLPEAVAAHVVSHSAALLGHPLVSSAGRQDRHCACTRRGCPEGTDLDCLSIGHSTRLTNHITIWRQAG